MNLRRTASQFSALTQNALLDALSNKVFLGVILFALLVISATGVVGALSLHQDERLFNDLILFASVLFLAGLAVYQGVRSLHREIESKTIFTVLTKPVSRTNFVIGKYFGSLAAVTIALATIFVLKVLAAKIMGYEITAQHAAAYYGLLLQVAVIVAVAMLFSSFSSPVLSSLFSGAVFVAGSLTPQLREAVSYFSQKDSPAKYVAETAILVLPDLEKMNLSFELTHAIEIPTEYIVSMSGYSASYVAVVLTLTCLLFKYRDLS